MTRSQCYTVFVSILSRECNVKNVTITLEESVADWARIHAAKHNTSVSRMLGQMLAEKMAQEDSYAQAMQAWFNRPMFALSNGEEKPYGNREELNVRPRYR